MGNAPSLAELPPEWENILPSITREDIVRSSRKKCRAVGQSVYLDDDLFDLDDDNHVPIALAILECHPHLKDIRFKLVPGRMTEENYWAALFGILHDGGIDIEDMVGAICDDYKMEDEDEVDESAEIALESEQLLSPVEQSPIGGQPPKREGNGKKGNKPGRTPIAERERAYYNGDDSGLESNAYGGNTPSFYLEEIKAQQVYIARLQKSLRRANNKTRKLALELHRERQKRHGEVANDGKDVVKDLSGCDASQLSNNRHKAEWAMHPDCIEFLKLDEHLKENLRKEKEKRLNEVRSQMKFILDTDDIKDSHGRWPCCGKVEYEAEGCAE